MNNENTTRNLFDGFNNTSQDNNKNLENKIQTNNASLEKNNQINETSFENGQINKYSNTNEMLNSQEAYLPPVTQSFSTNSQDINSSINKPQITDISLKQQSNSNKENNFKSNKNKKNKKLIIIICVFFISLIIGIILFTILNKKSKKIYMASEKKLQSIEINGFELDKDFDENTLEYNVEVDMDEIHINCNGPEDTTGCNVLVDLKDKDKYDHVIEIVNKDGKKVKYVIHIKKDKSNKDAIVRIKSIKGNPLEWTNENAKISIDAVFKNGDADASYSFDNGVTWQNSNMKEIDSNQVVVILAKDKQGNVSEIKEISVDKIDKEKPSIQLQIIEQNSKKIVIQAITSDTISGISGISYNSKEYTTRTTYEITEPGTYKATSKDKAGNISQDATITIKDSDFKTVSQNKEKTYKYSFESNGANISKSSASCTTKTGSCKIALPTITRLGSTILGFSTSKDSITAKYKSGAIIDVSSNETLYAITYKTYTATFDSNGPSIVATPFQSCRVYNSNTTCAVSASKLSRNGGNVIGWATTNLTKESSLRPGETLKLKSSVRFYAITYANLNVRFSSIQGVSVSSNEKKCKIYNKNLSCSITTPTFSKTGWDIVGWNENSNANTAFVKVNSPLTINLSSNNKTYYPILKQIDDITVTATFYFGNNTVKKQTCSLSSKTDSCEVTAPYYNITGQYNVLWSKVKNQDVTLKNTNGEVNKVNPEIMLANQHFTINKDNDYYTNNNHPWTFFYGNSDNKNYKKVRTLSIKTTRTIDNTIFEYENGISDEKIENHYNAMLAAKNKIPGIFKKSAKVFVMTQSTYETYSSYYGLTHHYGIYSDYRNNQYLNSSFVDLKDDDNGISINATIHELGHVYDQSKSGSTIFKNTYEGWKSEGLIPSVNSISQVEMFAATITNYYWNVLKMNESEPYYGFISKEEMQEKGLDGFTATKNYVETNLTDLKP